MAPYMKSEEILPEEQVKKTEQKPVEAIRTKIEEKETLGNYSDAVVPFLSLVFGYVCGLITCHDIPIDPRTSEWFLMDWSGTCLILSTIYILICTVWGPRYMRGRKPYELKKTIMVYNIFQVFLSAYMFYEFGMSGWFVNYSITCQAPDFSNSAQGLRMARVVYIFFLSKILDFLDTFFFVGRKKNNQISLLHLIHHSFMVSAMWFGTKYSPGGHQSFMGLLNSGVHTVMYFYYFLSGLGPAVQPYLWWKKYITRIQLIQFVAILLHSLQVFVQPSCTGVYKKFCLWFSLYAILFFGLFMHFYRKAYKKSNKRAQDDQLKESQLEKSEPNGVFPKSLTNGITRRTVTNVVAHSVAAVS